MASWFKNPIVQFVIMAALAAASVFAAYNIFFLERKLKALQVVILADTSVVQVQESVGDKLQVYYGNAIVDNLSLIQLKVENTGNEPILATDFERSAVLIFPVTSAVIEASVSDSNPANIGLTLSVLSNTVTLSNVLLNPGDKVILRMLVADLPTGEVAQPFQFDVRIVGVLAPSVVTAIQERSTSVPQSTLRRANLLTVGVLDAALFAFAAFIFRKGTTKMSVFGYRLALIAVAFSFGFVVLVALFGLPDTIRNWQILQ